MKPIMFNTEMVQANLGGFKTATRRIMNPQPHIECYNGEAHEFVTDDFELKFECSGFVCRKCGYGVSPPHSKYPCGTSCIRPKYQPGDILYVRETWVKLWYVDPDGYTHFDQPMYYYAADGTPDITLVDDNGFVLDDNRIRWHPSIHMPREAARLFLNVTNVRVERLQDIDEEGAKAEGANFCNGKHIGFEEKMQRSAVERFAEIWNRTIKPADIGIYGWDANPYVWVIEYEQCEKPEL